MGVLVDRRNFGQFEASILNITPVRYMLSPIGQQSMDKEKQQHTHCDWYTIYCVLSQFVLLLFCLSERMTWYIRTCFPTHTYVFNLSVCGAILAQEYIVHTSFPSRRTQVCTCKGWAVPKPGHEPVEEWGCKHVVAYVDFVCLLNFLPCRLREWGFSR